MSQGLAYGQAAAILGCPLSNVDKLIRRGGLISTGKRGASLNRRQVEALVERRAAERAAKATRHPVGISVWTFAPTMTTSRFPSHVGISWCAEARQAHLQREPTRASTSRSSPRDNA
jgi:hypothetical protein